MVGLDIFLAPFAVAYSFAMNIRNLMYDLDLIKAQRVKAKVISVGNLTVGGTGKTPLILELCQLLKKENISFAIISRGYGRKGKDDQAVNLDHPQATLEFGDEPVWLKQMCPDAPVWVGSDRVRLANMVLQAHPNVQVLLADDAFQHRRLYRDLDILVVDTAQPLKSVRALPLGRARESLAGAKRADVIVLSKVNLVELERVKEWRRAVARFCRREAIWAEAEYHALELRDLSGRQVNPAGPFVAVSGIGNPAGFRQLLVDQLKLNIVRERWYRDHQKYTLLDLDDWQKSLRGDERIVVTSKDAVKLKAIRHAFVEKIVVASIDVRWRSGGDRIYAAMSDLAL